MALAHFHVGTISRSTGRSAVDAAAYVLRTNLLDQRTGQSYSYGRDAADAVKTFVWLPKNAPEKYHDAAVLANYMETREARVNSRTARTFEGALPHELTDLQREFIVRDFARELTRKGLAVIVGIHRPHEHGDQRNHHFHMIVSTRTMDAQGFGAKLRELDKVETLEHWRERFEVLTNKKLEQHGHAARIDMRSYAAQGRDQTPQIHVGPVAAALERKGIETDRGDQVRSVLREQWQERTWTEGRARIHAAVPVEVESAVERKRREEREDWIKAQQQADKEERRRTEYQPDASRRGLLAALWSLAKTSGNSLAHALLGANRAELLMGRRVTDEFRPQSREMPTGMQQEQAVPAPQAKTPQQETTETVMENGRSQTRMAQTNVLEERRFVDRGNRAAPYRAMLGELRDNELDAAQAIGVGNAHYVHEKDSPKLPIQAAPIATRPREETFVERWRRERGPTAIRESLEKTQDMDLRHTHEHTMRM